MNSLFRPIITSDAILFKEELTFKILSRHYGDFHRERVNPSHFGDRPVCCDRERSPILKVMTLEPIDGRAEALADVHLHL
jgi:hypothetical protein